MWEVWKEKRSRSVVSIVLVRRACECRVMQRVGVEGGGERPGLDAGGGGSEGEVWCLVVSGDITSLWSLGA